MGRSQTSPVKSFDPSLALTRYPSPLALAYGALVECETSLARLFALRDIIEVALKFCAVIAIKDYLRLGARALAVDSSLAFDLRRPQLGSWNNLLRETLRSCQKMREKSFAPPLIDFYFEPNGAPRKRNHELVDNLIKFRNRTLAHGARPREDAAAKIFQSTQPLVEQLLSELDFLADYALLSFNETGECELLAGCNPQPFEPPANLPRDTNQLYLMRGENLLSLHPLLIRERCDYEKSDSDVCPYTKIFFFNGGERKPEYLDYLMNHTKYAPRVADSLQEIISTARKNLNVEVEEGARLVSFDLIHELARSFVGRETEEERILQFLQTESRGYVKVVGDPGIGKSALLARTVLDLTEDEIETRSAQIADLCSELKQSGLAVAFHVCTGRRKSTTDVAQIISSLAEQLVKQYGASISAPAKPTLDALLDVARMARQHFSAKALLVIDGIDEALVGRSLQEQEAILDALPLREELPEGVFVLVSARRGVLDDPPAPFQTLKLAGLSAENIRQILTESDERLCVEEKDLNAVRRVSESNPLYIRLLINDLRLGNLNLDEIERLPPGLIGYFEDFIKRLCVDAEWTMLHDCLLLLALARSHLSIKQICAMTDFDSLIVIEAIEYKLQPILVDLQSPQGEIKFQLFHEKLREFLLDLFSGKTSAETISRLNRYFIKAAPNLRASGEVVSRQHLETARARLLKYCREWRARPEDDYPVKHLPFHLFEARAVDELQELLLRTEFLETKIKRLEDTNAAAEDVRYLTAALLETKRDAEIIELAVAESSYRRDGVIAALIVTASEEKDRIERIARALLEREDKRSSAFARLRSALSSFIVARENISIETLNARRAGVEIAYRLGFADELIRAAQDGSEIVRTLLVPYIYRFWKKRRAEGWALLRRLSEKLLNRFGLPNPTMIETYGSVCLAILIYHFNEPETTAQLRAEWKSNVRRVLHLPENSRRARTFLLRAGLRAAIFLLTNMLRLLLSRQPTFQPINLREMAVSYRRPGEEQRRGLSILKCLENPESDFEPHLDFLLDNRTPFGIYLMMVLERVLVFHGARAPERTMRALYRLHREGCSWFRQSGLYAAFHTLKRAARVEDQWLAWYAQMTRETISAMNATFTTGNFMYELIPHIAWAEMVFDQHRPTGKARFIPEFYRAARQAGDTEYARRTLEACAILSLAYGRHELALDAMRVALKESAPKFRQLVINPLAQIRFNDEEAVSRFLERENETQLARQISGVASNLKANDIVGWIDEFMNNGMIESDEFRAEIVGAFERAGHARNLTELLQQILKWTINISVGEEFIPIESRPRAK